MYIIGQVLGEGSFGRVRLATNKHSSQTVAIKIVEKKGKMYLYTFSIPLWITFTNLYPFITLFRWYG